MRSLYKNILLMLKFLKALFPVLHFWFLNLDLICETLCIEAVSGLLISMLGKLNWFCLTGLMTNDVIYVKTNGSLLRKNHLLRCWGCLSLLNWIGAPTLPLSLKLLPRKLEPWLVVWSFFLLRLLCISVNLPYDLVWNTVVILGMVLVAASWNC